MSAFQWLPAHVINDIVGYVADEAAGASAKQLLLVSHRWRRAVLRHINREYTIDLRQQTTPGTIAISNKYETLSFDAADNIAADELTVRMAANVNCLRIAVGVQEVFSGEAARILGLLVQSGRLVCMRLRRLVFALGHAPYVNADPEHATSGAERLARWIRQLAPRAHDVAFVEAAGFTGRRKASRSSLDMRRQGALHANMLMHLLGRASHMDVGNLGPTYFADKWVLGDRQLTSIRCLLDDGGHMAQVVRSSSPSLESLWVNAHSALAPASILCDASGQPTQYPRLRVLTFKHAGRETVYPEIDREFAPVPRLERLVLHGACAFNEVLFRGNTGTLRSLAADVDMRMARVLQTVGPLESLQHAEMDCWADYMWSGQAGEFVDVAVGVAPNAVVLSLGAHLVDVAGVLAPRLAASRCAQSLRVLRLRGIELSRGDAAIIANACPRLVS
ncbi:hypothetical protein LPJ53_003663 [Coemansia erecta]|uniref:Uncharacterized protein n=1 Tax=Coemansia erecta TaxID=147472 RepID=A0A9W8CS69_9FUNG|nr:hypothetical protein LPJ53_003663 [Coemansia erecta]